MYYLESDSTKYSIIHTLRKICQRNAQIWVNMVIVMSKKYGKLVIVMNKIREICSSRQKEMHKFTAKFGGYCPKLEKNMVGLYPKTYNQVKNVSFIRINI